MRLNTLPYQKQTKTHILPVQCSDSTESITWPVESMSPKPSGELAVISRLLIKLSPTLCCYVHWSGTELESVGPEAEDKLFIQFCIEKEYPSPPEVGLMDGWIP